MSKKIKQFNENFDNVVDDLHVYSDVPFGKANEEHDQNKKNYEDAIKENEKLAKETIPKEEETGKKVKSKALKAMHLSESLFDDDTAYDRFEHELYRAMVDVVKDYIYNDITYDDIDAAVNHCLLHMEDDDELQDYGIFNESLGTKLCEDSLDDVGTSHATADSLANSYPDYKFKIKGTSHIINGTDLLDYLEPDSYIHYMKTGNDTILIMDKEYLDNQQPSSFEESIKYNIAKEKLQKFNEGLFPKTWNPTNYLDRLVKKNHLTESQADRLKKRYL